MRVGRAGGRPALLALAVACTAVTACSSGGGSTSATSAAPTSSAPSASASVSASGSANASPSGTASGAGSPSGSSSTGGTGGTGVRRTVAELRSALLELEDLPGGFQEEDASDGGAAPTASSSQARCAPLVRLSNTERPPGSTAFAEAAFSGGQAGPFVTETLDALGSARRVTALIADYEDAVRACRSLTLTVPGQGRSTFAVRVVRAPETSSPTFAARFSATGGALEGLELTFVLAAVEDVVVTTTFVGATPEDVEGGAGLAVDKAVEVLGAGAGGA